MPNVTVELIDQIAAGLRDALGANAKARRLNEARIILGCILDRLAATDLDVHKTAALAAIGRLKALVPMDVDPSKVITDPCDPLHVEFLLLVPTHMLRKFAHDVTHHTTRTKTTVMGPIPMDDLPGPLREFFDNLRESRGGDDLEESTDE